MGSTTHAPCIITGTNPRLQPRGQMALVAGVVNTEEKRWHECNDHEGHEALQVQAVPYMGVGRGGQRRGKGHRFDGIEQGVQFFQAATGFKMGPGGVEQAF
jgi:hypothetical protein